jgi:type II secretory pathway pseudopilin PulG
VEGSSTQAARPLGKTVKKRTALFWVALSFLVLATAVAGAFTAVHFSKHSKARHDVQVIALALDGFAMENGDFPKGTRSEICRLLRGESINGQNPKELDYVEALPTEMNGTGEFLDPWGEPYRMSVYPKTRVYSCGPNRIDEQGDGDDIVSWK